MSTIILGVAIFGACVLIIRRALKKGSACEDCTVSCAVKQITH